VLQYYLLSIIFKFNCKSDFTLTNFCKLLFKLNLLVLYSVVRVRCRHKKFTFTVSFLDELLGLLASNTVDQLFCNLYCYMSVTIPCVIPVYTLLLTHADIFVMVWYAGSSLEVKTETDSEDAMVYLLSLNTNQVRTST